MEESEENNSTTSTSKTRKSNYLGVLREIDKLLNLSANANNPNNLTEEAENIFENITTDIEWMSNQMFCQKHAMLLISILNAVIRVAVLDGFDNITARDRFQSMLKKLGRELSFLTASIVNQTNSFPTLSSDILDSMFLNLAKDDFVQTCFNRLLSDEITRERSHGLNTTQDVNQSNYADLTIINQSSVVGRGVFQNDSENKKTDTSDEESIQEDRIGFNQIVEIYMDCARDCTYNAVFQSSVEVRNNYSSLIISLEKFVNNYLTNADRHASTISLPVIISILGVIWNLTDKISLMPMFIDMGYVEKAIRWIRTDIFASNIENLGSPILNIIHNLSRDNKGLKQFHTAKAFDILIEHKELVHEKNCDELTKIFGMTLTALAVSDEQSEENKRLILDTGETLYNCCKEAEQNINLRCGGFHLSESLELLHRAFSNTYVVKHILENKNNEKPTPIQYFARLLLSFYGALLDPEPDELERRVVEYLLKILLQISSYPEYLKELTDNKQLCIIVECLAKRPKQDDAKRIWSNIQQIRYPDKKNKLTSSKIYISYDSADEEFCKELVKEMRNRITIPVSVEYENVELSDDMWEYASSSINSAMVIVALVSNAYGQSTDKFQELSYIISTKESRHKKKALIVVEAEPDFSFNRSWMRDLLCNETVISYETNIAKIASKVCRQIAVPRKSLIRCFQCHMKNVRRTTGEWSDFSPEHDTLKSLPTADSNLASVETYVQKKSSNVTDESSLLMSTKRDGSYSIVAGLVTQTGSTDCSTWV